MEILKENPFQNPPPYEKLVGNLKDKYSRRLNIQHRVVYSVDNDAKEVFIWSAWTHYERWDWEKTQSLNKENPQLFLN